MNPGKQCREARFTKGNSKTEHYCHGAPTEKGSEGSDYDTFYWYKKLHKSSPVRIGRA
jgi:hypothetical protein